MTKKEHHLPEAEWVDGVVFHHAPGTAITSFTWIQYLPWNPGIQPYPQAFWTPLLCPGISIDHIFFRSSQKWTLNLTLKLLQKPYSFVSHLLFWSPQVFFIKSCEILPLTEQRTELPDFPVHLLCFQGAVPFWAGMLLHQALTNKCHQVPYFYFQAIGSTSLSLIMRQVWFDLTKHPNSHSSEFISRKG